MRLHSVCSSQQKNYRVVHTQISGTTAAANIPNIVIPLQKTRPALIAAATPFLTVTMAIAGAHIVLNFRGAFAREIRLESDWSGVSEKEPHLGATSDSIGAPIFTEYLQDLSLAYEVREPTSSQNIAGPSSCSGGKSV